MISRVSTPHQLVMALGSVHIDATTLRDWYTLTSGRRHATITHQFAVCLGLACSAGRYTH